jgi:hypothetical protein
MGPACTKPSDQGTCPQGCAPLCACAAPDTLIATATGQRPIAELRVGDRVLSVHRGRLSAVPLLRVQRTPVDNHHVVRLRMDNGARIEMSAGHPTADGRTFGDLASGDRLDGAQVLSAERIAYAHPATYDILPASDTGAYYAAGVLVGSTLAPTAQQASRANAACQSTAAPVCAGR